MTLPAPTGGATIVPGESKSVLLAVGLTMCCLLGISYFYLGQHAKGLAMVVVGLVCVGLTPLTGAAGFLYIAIWVLQLVDVLALAQRTNSGRALGPWEFFWTLRAP